ncbi:MAG TPA: AMIN domain-containing protein, partial [Usitatibacteraceae bacterium]|nr:AMIN domain-containing protein [Usitatibacteraceae bacterium]
MKPRHTPARRWVTAAIAKALAALLIPINAYAVALTGMNFAATPTGGVQLQVQADGALAPGRAFLINDPPRLVIDLPATDAALPERTKNVDTGPVGTVVVVPGEGRTRLVVNLVETVKWSMTTADNTLLVMLDAPGAIPSAARSPTPAPAPMARSAGPRLSSIDFHRGDRGEGRIVVGLSSPDVQVNTRPQGGRVVVEFSGVGLPAELSRRLDVTDFATPVTRVETRQYAGGVRMEVATGGAFEHLAYQANGQYTLEISPVRDDPAAQRNVKKAYSGEPISLNFQSIEVRAVLQLLADFTGKNLVAADTVAGNITLRLQNVPWDQALDIVLKTKGLDMRRKDNVILVAPQAELAAQEKAELEAQKDIQELAPLRTEFLTVNYAKASEIARLVKSTGGGSLLSERGNVTVDERTNTLLVQDTADNLTAIRSMVATLDIPVRQVLIESRIVIVSDDFSRDLGVRAGFTRVSDDIKDLMAVSGSAQATDTIMGSALDNLASSGQPFPVEVPFGPTFDRYNVNMPVANPAGRIAL